MAITFAPFDKEKTTVGCTTMGNQNRDLKHQIKTRQELNKDYVRTEPGPTNHRIVQRQNWLIKLALSDFWPPHRTLCTSSCTPPIVLSSTGRRNAGPHVFGFSEWETVMVRSQDGSEEPKGQPRVNSHLGIELCEAGSIVTNGHSVCQARLLNTNLTPKTEHHRLVWKTLIQNVKSNICGMHN